MRKERGDRAVVEALREEGVEFVFGLPGGHSFAILYDALYDTPEIKTILVRHETAGAFMAFGYAQVSGKIGVCQGTAGPGWAQMLPGAHEAWASKTPMLLLAPTASTGGYGLGAIQEFPQSESVLTFAKWAYTVERTDKIPWVMRRAFTIAQSAPPGPVFVNIPTDIGMQTVEMQEYRKAPLPRKAGDPEAIARAMDILLASELPIIVAGRGVHQSQAWEELKEFAELLLIPVLCTNSGKSAISETHPLFAGGVGINRTSVSEEIYEASDCQLWIGSQLESFAVSSWFPQPNKKFIHIDADPTQFGRNWTPDAYIEGDAKLVLRQCIDYCKDKVRKRDESIPVRISKLWDEYYDSMKKTAKEWKNGIYPSVVLDEIQKRMPENTIIVLGEGANRAWTASHLRIPRAGHWVSASDYGCMGFSVAGAIGAKLARPESTVISITGDGSFQMQMQEIVTALQYDCPVLWVVMNNDCLGWIKWGIMKSQRFIAVEFEKNWRFDQVARACGCEGFRAEKPHQLPEAIQGALSALSKGIPAVLDVKIPQLEQSPGFLKHSSGR